MRIKILNSLFFFISYQLDKQGILKNHDKKKEKISKILKI